MATAAPAAPNRPPPSGSSSGGPPAGGKNGPDIDMVAVEGIPRETLVALLKRKDKEAKTATAKLEKLEERYVKVVRFNKILHEDRQSFLRFCNELLPESDAVFEEAAAQESPVNAEALMQSLSAWRHSFEAAREDRRIFRQFAELAFPGDEVVAQLFEEPSLSPETFNMLQHRWVALEDLHNQSIASINALAREQVMAKTRELEEAVAARREAERKAEELRDQLTRLAREKAQLLTQRLQGGGIAEGDAQRATSSSAGNGACDVLSSEVMQQEREALREAREARDAADRRERKSQEAAADAERREQELRGTFEAQTAEVRRLQAELERVREEGEKHRAQARQLLQQKDEVLSRLTQRLSELEQEMSSNAFIERFAEQQAGRDREVKAQQTQLQQVMNTLSEIQKLLSMSYSQERLLKSRIRELEQSQDRQGQVGGDYLKHVIMKYIEYNQKGDLKGQTLVPVLCTLLSLSPEERRSVEKPGIPTPLLYLNQAVGEATSWLYGGSEIRAIPGATGREPAMHPALVSTDAPDSSSQLQPHNVLEGVEPT